jgi:hypothetical protein
VCESSGQRPFATTGRPPRIFGTMASAVAFQQRCACTRRCHTKALAACRPSTPPRSRVQRLDGTTVALHRTYLARGGAGQADVPTSRKLTPAIYQGATRGAAIRLAEPTAGRLALTEGIETAVAVIGATGAPTWSCVSAGGIKAVELSDAVREADLWADADNVGRAAAERRRSPAQRRRPQGTDSRTARGR